MGDKKTILIVGRSGNGNTSLAKSITGLQTCKMHHLDEEDHKQDPYLQIEQYDGTQGTQDTRDTRYNVLVCSCIGDNEEDFGYDFATIKIVAEKALRIGETCGIDAVVFAMKYGVRFPKQKSDSVDIVKRLFGEHVFAERVVIAFSYGDIFEYDKDMETQEAFKEWCLQQQGSVKILFKEVNYRCVLFNNKVKDQTESLNQLKTCIEKINTVKDLKLQAVPRKQIPVNKLKKEQKRQRKQVKKQYKNQKKLLKEQHKSKVNELNNHYQSQPKELGPKQIRSQVKEREKQQKTKKNELKEHYNRELQKLKEKKDKELADLKQ